VTRNVSDESLKVTARNAPTSRVGRRSWLSAIAPVFLFATTIVASGCLQQASFGRPNGSARGTGATPTRGRVDSYGLGEEDPRLGMSAVGGGSVDDISTSSVQVLPAGNVQSQPAAELLDVLPTTVTRWVKSTVDTTLWSGSDAAASAFTDVPADSLFRVSGPDQGGRLPVYYVGDGLLRRPGSGWVDSTLVETVDAPPPGQDSAVDADASQPLPVWVQAHRATTLWSGPDEKAVPLTDLPQWTFLKVAGLERDGRLLVNYAGDYANRQPGIGWVDQASVGPAGDPGRWVANFRATALWSGVDDEAVRFTDAPQWTKLRIVEGAPHDGGRVQVDFFGDGFTRKPGVAWIARADIGPITPPVPLPALPVETSTSARQVEQHTFSSTSDFIDTVGAAARRSHKTTGVPASVTVAQAILESDWGRSRLTRQGNNLFGIKALGGAVGPAGVVSLATWEHVDDGDVVVQAPFRAYQTLEQSIDDHGKFFASNRRYAAALAVASDARAFARAIQDAGYATDPSYASKLIRLMDRYNLYRFDS
jgi:Mannosyl-glycoprotein endo-beta-N-acetylglucosaminidase